MKKEQESRGLGCENIYLDATVLIDSTLRKDEIGKKARRLIEYIKVGKYKAFTTVLTIDELMWVVQKVKSRKEALEAANLFLMLPNLEFVPINTLILSEMLNIYQTYELNPRDAIHVAVMLSKDIDKIITRDRDFDKIKGIKRIDFSKWEQ